MTAVDLDFIGDTLHRLAKIALDSGEAASIEEAIRIFRGYALHINVDDASDAARQAALVTAVNAGHRAFLGGVTVAGLREQPCLLPPWAGRDLAEAVRSLGGVPSRRPPGSIAVCIGLGVGIRAIVRGWAAGVAPSCDSAVSDEPGSFVLAGVAAGAMAVAEAFQVARGDNPAAGRRRYGVSLWQPQVPWTEGGALGRDISRLPSSAWLIGLGNLGQSFLWSLGMLPYPNPARLELTLQDFDRLAPANESTSLLTSPELVGRLKTRAMAEWAERRGYATRIVERAFGAGFEVGADDPAVALCGVDNGLARSVLEEVGFARVVEVGLGGGPADFLGMRLHTFPGPNSARALWRTKASHSTSLLERPAYRALAAAGGDPCGLVRLAGRTVGAPFVGALAGAMAISELVKLAEGATCTAVLDLHLRSPSHMTAIMQDESFGCSVGGIEIA